ncbi:neuropeptide FF receptor 2-like [Coccinella septempunctata]|uniref:neuropeptide FF receptor 2-like n=1 Tax=Coccinella septempunctata TaxID=41139 RepID=UPI001D0740BA|nr:neuropeptide FF receptor 2-like [Coccinella septempunctata]XP_044746323.1 neuropeptide FF receptor 2-like [Coccinella septempunctata]
MSVLDDDSSILTSQSKAAIEEYVRKNLLEEKYGIIALYIPVFLSALVANCLVILVVIKDQYMRSVTNYFLVNLSVADLLVTLICMPKAAIEAYKSTYDLGRYSCKISSYLQCVAVSSSIFTITAMALDRYLAIAKPMGFFYRCFNKKTTTIVIICLWSFSLTLLFPMYIIVDLHNDPLHFSANITVDVEICHEDWSNFSLISRENMGVIWFICIFTVPGAIMIFGYSMMGRTLCSSAPPFDNDGACYMQQRNRLIRSRKRVACILLLLACIFAICWLPYHIMLLWMDISNSEDGSMKETKKYLLLLGHANSALNPIIYCALSRRFRNSIKDLFDFKIHFSRKRNRMQWADSSGSASHLNYMQRMKSVPVNNHHYALSRLNSSQRTTKTCAV